MGKEIWTYSRIKARMNCPRMEHLRYTEGLTPIKGRASLNIGSAVHKGIETRSVSEALKLLEGIEPHDQQEADELEVAKATVEGMMWGYLMRFPPFKNHHEPEKEFEIPLPLTDGRRSRKHFIAGKMDDVVHLPDGDWLVEYKTASQLSAAYFDRLYVDEQITMYMWALKKLGFNPVGVIYRVIRKPSIRPRKGEGTGQFALRVQEEYRTRPDFYFMEQRYYRSVDDLAAFEESLRERILAFERDKRRGCNHMNTGQCAVYSGCGYLPLCVGEANAMAMFERRDAHEELESVKGESEWD